MAKLGMPQRQQCYGLHLGGETYAQIARRFEVSKECVRYWCRRQRDGGDIHTHYGHRYLAQRLSGTTTATSLSTRGKLLMSI